MGTAARWLQAAVLRRAAAPAPQAAAALVEGAGSGQPWAGGSGSSPKGATKEREKLAGSRQHLQRGLKHQPLAPGQAVKVFLPWRSGSAELGGKQGRWSGLSQSSGTGASWPLRLQEHEAASTPQAILQCNVEITHTPKSQVEEPGPHRALLHHNKPPFFFHGSSPSTSSMSWTAR